VLLSYILRGLVSVCLCVECRCRMCMHRRKPQRACIDVTCAYVLDVNNNNRKVVHVYVDCRFSFLSYCIHLHSFVLQFVVLHDMLHNYILMGDTYCLCCKNNDWYIFSDWARSQTISCVQLTYRL